MSKSNEELLAYFAEVEAWAEGMQPLIQKLENREITIGGFLSWWSRRPRLKEVILEEEVSRLKKIVEAPWKCPQCGNYVTNESIVVEM